jgi:hypothetical protein
MEEKKPRLEVWSFVTVNNSPYHAPEQGFAAIKARVYDDPRFPDSCYITTSRPTAMSIKEGWVQTKNTRYQLGQISLSFIGWMSRNGHTLEKYEEAINAKGN